MLLRRSDKQRFRLAPDKFCVTLIRDPEHHLGKVFRADGSKATTASISWGEAVTVRCETPEELAAVYGRAGSDPHAALILDYFDGIPPLRQTSCRLPFHADDPRRSDNKCKRSNIPQSSLSRH